MKLKYDEVDSFCNTLEHSSLEQFIILKNTIEGQINVCQFIK